MDNAEVRRSVFSRDCQSLIGISILFYDSLLTLDQEANLIWPYAFSPFWSRSSLSYLVLRYTTIFAYVAVLCCEIIWPIRGKGCSPFMLFRQVMFIWCHAYVYALLSMRVYALYDRKKIILVALWTLAAGVIAVAVWGVIYGSEKHPTIRAHCLSNSPPNEFYRKAIAWEGLLVGDSILFVMTFWKSWKLNRNMGVRGGIPIVNLILRDGAMYFSIMLAANAANVATFYLNRRHPGLGGSLSTFSSCVSVCMMSRMSLNLQERALLEGTTAGQFTTQTDDTIELGERFS